MTRGPALRLAENSLDASFGPRGELRQKIGENGRVHMDRWLPFIVLHRAADDEDDVARDVALNCPSYLLWTKDEEAAAQSALATILERLREELGQVLLIEVSELDRAPTKEGASEHPPFEIRVGASGDEAARAGMNAFVRAAQDLCIDLRSPEIHVAPFRASGECRLSIAMSPIHRGANGQIYPQLSHDLAVGLIDSILRAAAAFMGASTGGTPPHFRSLGRSAVLAAALKADKKLDAICASFDFLLSVTPINTAEAYRSFIDGGADREPDFHYRPLTVDPDLAKRDLYAVDLSILEDPLLEQLLGEKRREVDTQLTMLATRNTPQFKAASTLLYGAVEPQLLSDAHAILASIAPEPVGGPRVGAEEVARNARELIANYRRSDERFATTVEVRDDVAGLLVSADRLFVASNTAMRRRRLDALLAHEVSVHLLTWCNGASQPLALFRTGLAGYEGVQEGLGVFAEWCVGGLTSARIRLLAGRVVAVDAMLSGASFLDVYRRLTGDLGFKAKGAFDITMRVFRAGGLAKDAIYLRGFRQVVDHVSSGASLDPFWLGKIAPRHVAAIEELLLRNLLNPPVFVPEFLNRTEACDRIDRMRSGLSFEQLLALE